MGAYSNQVVADGASYYWRLGETSGTTAAATVGGAPGTISGGVTLGQPGPLADGSTAMLFDGTTGKIQVGSVTLPAISTLEAWVKPTSGDVSGSRPIVTWGTAQSPSFYRRVPSGVGWVIRLYDGSGTGNTIGVITMTADVWYHVVYVLNSTTVVQYVNGVLDITAPAARAGANVDTVQIGGDPAFGDAQAFANGSLAEIAVYPTTLTPAQIANHYALRTATGGGGRAPNAWGMAAVLEVLN